MVTMENIRKDLGLVQVYTGNGKGKTTAALGLSFRAAGRGLNVLFLQFMKPPENYGEHIMAERIDNITMMPLGLDHFVSNSPTDDDVRVAHEALAKAEELLISGKYDLVVLDESLNAVRLGLITSAELLDTLRKRHANVEVVLTGRGLPDDIRDYADLVTEMQLVKHPFDEGIDARMGIEY
ncbi:cob(I)alamin adenosyltransferase [Thermoplasmatales archaeon BRNA1]|nr:cob(I)alamin adenosyltransferase [Thermoplasmatales archaeon BRNA1]